MKGGHLLFLKAQGRRHGLKRLPEGIDFLHARFWEKLKGALGGILPGGPVELIQGSG
jgi:hypothetical protein